MKSTTGAFAGGVVVLFFFGIAALIFLSNQGVKELKNRWQLGAILRPDTIRVDGPQTYESAVATGADCYCITQVMEVEK